MRLISTEEIRETPGEYALAFLSGEAGKVRSSLGLAVLCPPAQVDAVDAAP